MPPIADGVQINCCRNALCENFGVLPIENVSRWTDPLIKDRYTRISDGAQPILRCRACGEFTTLISNQAVVEERDRLLASPPMGGACRTPDCANLGLTVSRHSDRYHRFGTTNAGSVRYRCKGCGKTFSTTSRASHRLRQPEKSAEVFRYLINRVAMRRLCALADISADTLYQRIDLLYARCREFARVLERPFFSEQPLDAIHVAVDRQQHILNWGSALDRRPGLVLATASAEARSGYVLAQHVNVDPDADPFELDLLARDAGDPDLPLAFKRYARLHLPYERLDAKPGVEETTRPVSRGVQVRENVSLAAHFQILAGMLRNAATIQFSMDREGGIDRAALLAFRDRVRAGTLTAFWVRIEKELTVANKRKAIAAAEVVLAEAGERYPELTEARRLHRLLMDRYVAACEQHSQFRDRWVVHPYPTMNEPGRAAVCLTPTPKHAPEDIAWGLARASLRSLDRYFMQLRRRVHLLERPMRSSSTGRQFYAYSPYSAVVVLKLVEIFRVAYNFHLAGQQCTTPAMRLGVAERAYSLQEIIDGPTRR